MSLDQNLFTLFFTQHKDNQNVVDLVDPSGTVHYRKQRATGLEYKIEIYDPMTESLLAIATAPSATSKVKTLELYNPTSVVELKFTGTLSFRWSFKWEEHEFEWKREECYMIRKPDPPVIIAVTKEPAGRLKTTSMQMLDYNLNRFDIDDRKGLEIVVLTALLTFHDANEAHHTSADNHVVPNSNPSGNPLSRAATALIGVPISSSTDAPPPPPPPPKPAPKTGIDRIAELQASKEEYNEITVSGEGSIQEYGDYCNTLLQDEAMLFITVKSSEAEYVPKVLQVVEETKRIRHKAGLSDDEELHQYVLYDTQEAKKGPRRINLDDNPKDKYAPPKSLTVHLSKIPLPELQPKGQAREKSAKDSKKKEEKKEDKKVSASHAVRSSPPAPLMSYKPPYKLPNNKLHRPSQSSTSQPRVRDNQVHPNQPPPSPSQINNPTSYAAPPPNSRPPPQVPNPGNSSYPSQATPSFPQTQIGTPWGGRPYDNSSISPNTYSPYGPHTLSTSSPSYLNTNSDFLPTTWTPPPPPSQPQIHQPQPVNANQTSSTPSHTKNGGGSLSQGASIVVQGLMDKLSLRR